MIDYYQILGVSPDATNEQIKEACDSLWLNFKMGEMSGKIYGKEKSTLLQETRINLSIPQLRSEYDIQYYKIVNSLLNKDYQNEQLELVKREIPPYVQGPVKMYIEDNLNKLNKLYVENKIVDRFSFQARALIGFTIVLLKNRDITDFGSAIKSIFLNPATFFMFEVFLVQKDSERVFVDEFIDQYKLQIYKINNITDYSDLIKEKVKIDQIARGLFVSWNNKKNQWLYLYEYQNIVYQYYAFKSVKDKLLSQNPFVKAIQELRLMTQMHNFLVIPKDAAYKTTYELIVDNFNHLKNESEGQTRKELFIEIDTIFKVFSFDVSERDLIPQISIIQVLRRLSTDLQENTQIDKIQDTLFVNLDNFVNKVLNDKDTASSQRCRLVLDQIEGLTQDDRRLKLKLDSLRG